jgi:hypothetical protein
MPHSSDEVEAYAVNRVVNNPQNDAVRGVEPAENG